ICALGFTLLFVTLHLMAMRADIWRRRVVAMRRLSARAAERAAR
ncbi:MAG: heme transporter HemC, partial [Nitratireductor rhodophyticola]